MLNLSVIGAVLIAVTIMIQAVVTTAWLRFLGLRKNLHRFAGKKLRSMRTLAVTGVVLMLMHLSQILTWALTYRYLVPEELQTLEKSVYFSFVTFTTLGYGDVTLSDSYRILSGIQALNGILLLGWSTAVLFAIVQRIWEMQAQHEAEDTKPFRRNT